MSDGVAAAGRVEVASRTDPGRDPEKVVNEDACRDAITPFGHLAVLCDGMGGHEGGREASNLAVETIFRHVDAAPTRPDILPSARVREVLHEALLAANHEVHVLGGDRAAGRPGATVVAALVHPLGTEVAHCGDSRCYLVHAGGIRQVTKDHSFVQYMVDAGVLAKEMAATHPAANRILRALGLKAEVEIELQPRAIAHEAGDTFVLCSDGLSDLVGPEDILRVVTSLPPADAVTELVDLANARGGDDNVTVMVVRTHEAALVETSPAASGMSTGEAAVTVAMRVAVLQPNDALGAVGVESQVVTIPENRVPGPVRRRPPVARVVALGIGLIVAAVALWRIVHSVQR